MGLAAFEQNHNQEFVGPKEFLYEGFRPLYLVGRLRLGGYDELRAWACRVLPAGIRLFGTYANLESTSAFEILNPGLLELPVTPKRSNQESLTNRGAMHVARARSEQQHDP